MSPTVTPQSKATPAASTAQANDTIILVLGQVGAGKSSFINLAVGHQVTSVSDEYCEGSHTKSISAYVVDDHSDIGKRYEVGSRILLVDTPGFNDSTLGDAENIHRISKFLASQPSSALAGIIYIYEITQDRLPSSDGYMSPSRFSPLSARKNVLLTTVKWSELRSREHGEERQERMRTQWTHIYDDGARIVPFNDSQESAREIIKRVCMYTTNIENLRRDLPKIFNASGSESRSSSRPASMDGDRLKDSGCFSLLFRSSRNTH